MSLPPEDPGTSHRLGYLLKHAHLRFMDIAAEELAPLGIAPREWAALNCLDEQYGRSQREVAELLGVDRTTMVALIDHLESRGWVTRRPQPDDRRKNAVVLTSEGRRVLQDGEALIDKCEGRFLGGLGEQDAVRFKEVLAAVIVGDQGTA